MEEIFRLEGDVGPHFKSVLHRGCVIADLEVNEYFSSVVIRPSSADKQNWGGKDMAILGLDLRLSLSCEHLRYRLICIKGELNG